MKYRSVVVKHVRIILLSALVAETALPFAAWARNDPKANNVQFVVSEKKVIITYDLLGTRGDKYRVNVFLRKESDPSRSYKPKLVSGDVGENVAPGEGRKIVWDLRKEVPTGLEGTDYFFVVIVEEQSAGFPWWTGAAVVGAGLLGLLVFSSGADQKDDEPSLPPPPGRP